MLHQDGAVLIFPEGKMSLDSQVGPFEAGVGMLASKLELPVVPVRIRGLGHVLHPTWKMARRGKVRVTFGAAMKLQGADYASLAKRVETATLDMK